MTHDIPEGHHPKNKLSKALKMGFERLQLLMQEPDAPEPAGYYHVKTCGRTYPYWCLEEIKCWMDGVSYQPKERTNKQTPRLENQAPYAVPAHSKHEREREQCRAFRRVIHAMRVAA